MQARWRTLRLRLDPDRLVFVDETWIKTNMAPLRGWTPKWRRLKGFAPYGRWRTVTFLAGLRRDGLSAPRVFDGPINQRSFQTWVEQRLVPTLRPGDLVILDNLDSDKRRAVRGAIHQAGAQLWFLPPYSPGLNPIEQAFAKIKHWMRDTQRHPSTTLRSTSARSLPPPSPANAKTTSVTLATVPPKTDALLALAGHGN